MPSDQPLPMSKQKLELRNDGTRPLEIMVEPTPNRYVLQPKDELVLIADAEDAPRAEGYTVVFYDGGVQLYAGRDSDPVVTINGEAVEADWGTAIPLEQSAGGS